MAAETRSWAVVCAPPSLSISLFNLELNPLAVFRELSRRLARLYLYGRFDY
jgi:hypothetical protein